MVTYLVACSHRASTGAGTVAPFRYWMRSWSRVISCVLLTCTAAYIKHSAKGLLCSSVGLSMWNATAWRSPSISSMWSLQSQATYSVHMWCSVCYLLQTLPSACLPAWFPTLQQPPAATPPPNQAKWALPSPQSGEETLSSPVALIVPC